MTSLPEQLSAVRQSQFDAQLNFLRSLTAQAFERAERVLALNISTSLASVEKSSAAVQQLIAMRDPRDLLALGAHTQDNLQSMLAYSRELMSIASGAKAEPVAARVDVQPAEARPADAQPTDAQPAHAATVQPTPAAAPASAPAVPDADIAEASTTIPAARGVKPSKKPVVANKPQPAPEVAGKATAIASAASEVAAHPAGAPRPLASPFPTAGKRPIAIPPIKPVEAAPPPAPVSGTPVLDQKAADSAGKPARKK